MPKGQDNNNPSNDGGVDERTTLETEILDSIGYEDDGDDNAHDLSNQSVEGDDGEELESNTVRKQEGQEQEQEQTRQQQQPQQDQQPSADSQGNIVDASGKIIARAGAERRWWGEVQKANTQVRALTQQNYQHQQLIGKARNIIGELQGELNGLRQASQLPEQLGLSSVEYSEALHLASRIKSNPIEGVKILLTRLAENGIDISQLGVSGAALDVGALSESFKKQIQEATQPFNDYVKTQKEQGELADKAKEGITEFFSQNPEAVPYAQQIGRLMSDPQAHARYGQLSMNEAWLTIKNHLLANRQQSPKEHQSTGEGKPRAMANGRGKPGVSGNKSIDNAPVSVDKDYGDILKDIAKDFNVSL